jgi:hypothetical protein
MGKHERDYCDERFDAFVEAEYEKHFGTQSKASALASFMHYSQLLISKTELEISIRRMERICGLQLDHIEEHQAQLGQTKFQLDAALEAFLKPLRKGSFPDVTESEGGEQ